jgi:hypothetical protein
LEQPVHVALVGLAPLIRDIVRSTIETQADIRIAACIDWGDGATFVAMPEPVDVYLVGARPAGEPEVFEQLLGARLPPHRVIRISSDGRQMHICELRPASAALGSLSPDELLEIVRGRPCGSTPANAVSNPGV